MFSINCLTSVRWSFVIFAFSKHFYNSLSIKSSFSDFMVKESKETRIIMIVCCCFNILWWQSIFNIFWNFQFFVLQIWVVTHRQFLRNGSLELDWCPILITKSAMNSNSMTLGQNKNVKISIFRIFRVLSVLMQSAISQKRLSWLSSYLRYTKLELVLTFFPIDSQHIQLLLEVLNIRKY